MISIITTVHNALAMNRLFLRMLVRYTDMPYELIVVDNNSRDGSRELFRHRGLPSVKLIENGGNYSYPRCQNQGIEAAAGEYLIFMNNDVIVSPAWASRMIAVMKEHRLDVLTPCGIEKLESKGRTRFYGKKWLWIKTSVGSILGASTLGLRLMHRLMYGNWERFCERRYARFGTTIINGLVGHSVMINRSSIDKIGLWDERIQKADHDLRMRLWDRKRSKGDVKLAACAMGIYMHHYVRLTCRSPLKEPLADTDRIIGYYEKWQRELVIQAEKECERF